MVSDEYIRMSREAKEIQEAWKPKDGDRIIYNDGKCFDDEKGFVKHVWNDMKGEYNFQCIMKSEWLKPIPEHLIWLPRQEDLQEFSLNNGDLQRITDYTNTFCKFIKKQHKEVTGYNNSWSKLWLLFVMETVYNKTWTGNGWVKQ